MGCALKFWLACFLLLFVGAELIDWFSHLGAMGGGMEASGTWLVLGGMGLAAASNAAHLPKRGSQSASITENSTPEETITTAASSETSGKATAAQRNSVSDESSSIAAQSKEDSISFKVRLPWR